jgi:hypothetical protein
MKLFACQACGQLLYFENMRCEHCGRTLGYLPDLGTLSSLEPKSAGGWTVLAAPERFYKFCDNARYGVCNWMLPESDAGCYCAACRHNRVIPDLSIPGNDLLWARMENAKHRLFYSLLHLHLPLANRVDDPRHGLAFDFLADLSTPHAAHVMTGHNNGLITLALKEADDAVREQVREAMGEPYRTLLGHFRHESGHYFWDRLVAPDPEILKSFRDLFGDEREDYAAALKRYYTQGAPPDWQKNFVSVYATSHPWEDFAESWAHYLHIVDTLETACAFDLSVVTRKKTTRIDFDPHNAKGMAQLIDAWLPITFTVNSLNRSMGQPDLYPFILAAGTIAKLGFIHTLTHGIR